MTRGASVRRPSATQRLLNPLLTSSQNISHVGQSYDRYTPSPGLSSDTPRLRCRFDLPLPETLESRADDAIMAGPIALWDVPDTLRGRTWQVDRVAILGLVQVDHRCVFGWMAFGVVQRRILPCWSHARDLVDSTGAVLVGGSRRVRDSCGSLCAGIYRAPILIPRLPESSCSARSQSCTFWPSRLPPISYSS